MSKKPRFETPWDELCHHVRNGCVGIVGLARQVKEPEIRLSLIQEAKRIDKALFKFKIDADL